MRTLIFIGVLCLYVSVYAQNSPPVAIDDTLYARLHEVHYVDLMANDYDPDGDSIELYSIMNVQNNRMFVDLGREDIVSKSMRGWLPKRIYFVRDVDPITGDMLSQLSYGYLHIHLENPAVADLDINNIKAQINAGGNNFTDMDGSDVFTVPNENLVDVLSYSSIWISGKHNNEVYASAELFHHPVEPMRFWSGPVSNHYDTNFRKTWDRVWKINRWDIQYHRSHYEDAAYVPHPRIADWPGNGDVSKGQSPILAPFEDINGNGIYEPMQGDYPLIKGDQAIFFVYNDDQFKSFPYYSNSYRNMKLEIRAMAYAFDHSHDDTLSDAIFISYEIENKSNRDYTDAYVGNFSSINLGYLGRDYMGSDVANGAFYGYGDTTGYGNAPATVGIQLLAGPEKDTDGSDNPRYDNNGTQLCDESINGYGFGNGIVDDERLGMSYFMFIIGKPTSMEPIWGAPRSEIDFYHYMTGRWRDSTNLIYGGSGHPYTGSSGPVTRFMYPGNSDPCNYGTGGVDPNYNKVWSEVEEGNVADGRKGMASSGPFTFKAGRVKHFDVAYVYARGVDSLEYNVPLLSQKMTYIKERFENDSIFDYYTGLNEEVASQKELAFKLYPNPGNDLLVVEFADRENCCEYIEVYNMQSQLVKRLQVKDVTTHIPTSDLTPGLYLIKAFKGSAIDSRKWIKL